MKLWGHLTVVAGTFAAVIIGTTDISYVPLRRGAIALVAVLAVISLLGRVPRALGPVGDSPTAKAIRIAGHVLVAIGAYGVIASFSQADNPDEKASVGIPVMTAMLAVFLLAFVAVTGRRSPVGRLALWQGSAIGLAGATPWPIALALRPPASVLVAVVAILGAMVAAGVLTYRRRGLEGIGQAGYAALLAGVVTAMTTVYVAAVLFAIGPDRWAPDVSGAALTVADRIEQNRVEAIDPYVGVLFFGCLLAAALAFSVLINRWGLLADAEPDPVDRPTPRPVAAA